MPEQDNIQCVTCGAATKFGYAECWKCHTDRKLDQAADEGYQEGYAAGSAAAKKSRADMLDKNKIRSLLQLCHPDKHNGSQISNEVTAWLLSIRSGA